MFPRKEKEAGDLILKALIKEYNCSLYLVRKLQRESEKENDKRLLGSMASDLQYSLDWLRSGRRPGNRRGVERRAAYQREKPMDPLLMQSYFDSKYGSTYNLTGSGTSTDISPLPHHSLSKEDQERLEDAMCELTEREKEMYIMSRGRCLTYCEIAGYLEISKSTVQTTVERAEKKIVKRINESLFSIWN